MSWRDDLERVTIGGREVIGASFRGVPFFVQESERSGGRRGVVHVFPLRSDPYVDDLGRKERTFRVTGFVVGDDYVAQRDRLLAALEDTAGPGQLVHPYYGELVAQCMDLEVKESSDEGGLATFSIEFAEAPAQTPSPSIVADTTGEVDDAATAATAAARADLDAGYNVVGMVASGLASAEAAIIATADALKAKLAPLSDQTQEVAALAGRVRLITARASELARAPADAFDEIGAALVDLATVTAEAPGAVLAALAEVYLADLGDPPAPTTADRAREAANLSALTDAIRLRVAVQAARMAARADYATTEDATAARDLVVGMLDERALSAGDATYQEIGALRAAVSRAVPGPRVFPRLATISVGTATPSIVIAHQLYGSTAAADDIVARNRVAHPGFVSGAIKVLSDGG